MKFVRRLVGWSRSHIKPLVYAFRSPRLVYGWLGVEFAREHRAVWLGVKRHRALSRQGSEIYELRRRVHMLEKGLTMRPRRPVFALDYIEAVVERLASAIRLGVLDAATERWASDVLTEYFSATDGSHPAIAKAFRMYSSLELTSNEPFVGPHLASVTLPTVTIADFAGLVHRRQSVRWFVEKAVPPDLIDQAVRLAVESPTACNRVPYRFEIFNVPTDARTVAELAGGTAGYVHNLQCVAVLVGDLAAYQHERDRHLIYIDASLAAMTFQYALVAQGLATLCINWPDLRRPEAKMANMIGLEPHQRIIMLIAIGFADGDGLVPGSHKRPLESVRRFRGL